MDLKVLLTVGVWVAVGAGMAVAKALMMDLTSNRC